MNTIKIYVENLSARNRGASNGSWFDLPVEMDYLAQKIESDQGKDEYIITDYEAPFSISEYESIPRLNKWAWKLAAIPSVYVKNMQELIDNFFSDTKDFIENWVEVLFIPEVTTDKEYGEYLVGEGGCSIPSVLGNYIDHEAFGRDSRIDDMIIYTNDGAFLQIFYK